MNEATLAPRVVVAFATNNGHKARELSALLASFPVEVVAASQVLGGRAFAVVEDGATFVANARKKAQALFDATGVVTVADDSGIEVDALGGRPGVRSARFAHEQASDEENNAALLKALTGVPAEARRARYRCALVLVDPTSPSVPVIAEAVCEGRVAMRPQGTGGFGYDPLFLVDACGGRSMAELSAEEKNAVSHRGAAIAALLPALRAVVARQPSRGRAGQGDSGLGNDAAPGAHR